MKEFSPESFHHCYLNINGIRYHYVDHGSGPVVLLLHGFPDLWYGWRFQIKYLAQQGFRVIVPDLTGFGSSEAPQQLQRYTFLSVSKDLVALLGSLGATKFNVIGHDWGGDLAWRMSQYFPTQIISLVSICTAFYPTLPQYIPLEKIIEKYPNLKYQLFLSQDSASKLLEDHLDYFFDSMFATKGFEPDGENPLKRFFNLKERIQLESLDTDYLKKTYRDTGFRGPLKWYQTRKLNHEDEISNNIGPVQCPSLLILSERDEFITVSMATKVVQYVPQCSIKSVNATHWAMIEAPDQVNILLLKHLNEHCGIARL
jgi:soluble epoxide hydrolase/lipid-phosphate phosphatase